MRWSYFCFFVWAISYGYPIAAAVDANSTSNGSSSTIQLVISYMAAGENSSYFDLTNLMEFLKNHSMNYSAAVLQKDRVTSTQISVPDKNNNIFNLTATEIANGLEVINTTTSLGVKDDFIFLFAAFSKYNESFLKLILVDIDPCSKARPSHDKSSTVTQDLINLVTNSSVKGLRVNLPIDITNATNASFVNNLNSLLTSGDYILAMNKSWQGNASRIFQLKSKFCLKKKSNNSTPAPSPTPASNTTLTPTPVSCQNSSKNTTECNGTTADQNFTTTVLTTTVTPANNTNTTTSGNTILNAVVAHKSGASVALGIIVVLLILIIVGLVYRRKIMHFIKVKKMRVNVNASDNQPCTVQYGSLYQSDDL